MFFPLGNNFGAVVVVVVKQKKKYEVHISEITLH